MFPDQDPLVLYDYYNQLGRSKQALIETLVDGHPNIEEQKENSDDLMGDLVPVDQMADAETIMR